MATEQRMRAVNPSVRAMQVSVSKKPDPAAVVRILLAEDDRLLADLVVDYLGKQGFLVDVAARGDLVEARLQAQSYDLMILDINLPGKSGLELLRSVRSRFDGGILVYTARAEDIDHVFALELGADDYVVKPVLPRVLLARIGALLRRLETKSGGVQAKQGNRLLFGALALNTKARTVELAGQTLDLSDAEFDLLWLLASRAGEILSRDQIITALRGIDYDGLDRSIDLRVSRVRRKLGDDALMPVKIKTVRGRGYLFNPYAWAEAQ